MRIRDTIKFVSGIVQLIIGVGLLITCVCLDRYSNGRVMLVMLPILCGIGNIVDGLEVHKKG